MSSTPCNSFRSATLQRRPNLGDAETSRSGSDMDTIGELFLVNLHGTQISADERAALQKLRPAGVVLLAQNFAQEKSYTFWLRALRLLLEDFANIVQRENIVVTIDHEGGRILRFPKPITWVPYPDAWNGKDKEVAELFAKELLASGVNLLLGPVADIHSNPANPVIGPRAFGTTSSEVSKRVVEFFQTIEAHGLRCCAKHFPGHGDTAIDSHVGLPSQSQDKEALLKRELLPFQKLIDAHISAIMTAHIVFPQIAPDKPATLAGAILTQILLEELHFSGVVISDSLMMGAIRDMFKDPHIPAAALQAGCDIFLISEERDPSILPFAMEIATALSNSMRKDPKIAQKVEETVSRVQAWRKTLPPFHVHELSSTVFAIHHALSAEILNHSSNHPQYPKHRTGN
jgi:beta-N-acetylhexosaminidase